MNSNLIQKTLGIIGGGQLGKMLLSECNKMNIKTHVLDPNEDSPCKKITNKFYCGDFKDFDTLVNFAAESHVDNSIRNPEKFINSNILGTSKILQNSLENNIENNLLEIKDINSINTSVNGNKFKFIKGNVELKEQI